MFSAILHSPFLLVLTNSKKCSNIVIAFIKFTHVIRYNFQEVLKGTLNDPNYMYIFLDLHHTAKELPLDTLYKMISR